MVTFSVNGGRNTSNGWTIDGADNLDRGANLTLYNYPSPDAIAEFKTLRGQYSAQFGRNASGQIDVITKSGSNSIHGSAYEFLRNDYFDANGYANDFLGAHIAPYRYNVLVSRFGGPVYHSQGLSRQRQDLLLRLRGVATHCADSLAGFGPRASGVGAHMATSRKSGPEDQWACGRKGPVTVLHCLHDQPNDPGEYVHGHRYPSEQHLADCAAVPEGRLQQIPVPEILRTTSLTDFDPHTHLHQLQEHFQQSRLGGAHRSAVRPES